MRRLALLLFCAGAALIPPIASAETLADALAQAIANNPRLEDARLGVRAAHEDRTQARAQYLPSVNANLQYGMRHLETDSTSFFGPSSNSVELSPGSYQLQATQPIYAGGRLSAQMDLANASIESNRGNFRNTEQEVLLQTVQAYAETQRDLEIVRLRQTNVSNLETQLNGTQRRLRVGEVTRTDVSQAQARLAGARAGLTQALADLEATRARYAEAVGHPPGDLAPALPPATLPATIAEARARARDAHPLIGEAHQAVVAARARTEIERAALRPQLSAVTRLDRQQESLSSQTIEDSWDAYAQLSIPLFEGGYRSARVRQGRINVSRAQAQEDQQERVIDRNVIITWNDYGAALQVVDAAREQVQANQTALEGVQRELGFGLRSTIEVLNSQQELLDSQVQLARAQESALVAAYALLAATGDLTLASTPGAPATAHP